MITEANSRKELIEFIKVPWRIYKGDDNWVAPIVIDYLSVLDKKKNPFFKHADAVYFVARDRYGTPLGRIAAIVDEYHLKYRNENVGYFGFFECVDDIYVAQELFDAAISWLKSRNVEYVRGPINLSMNNECGLLIEGFDGPPVFMMPYNPVYYIDLIEKNGFYKAKDLYAFWRDTFDDTGYESVKKLSKRVEKLGYVIRNVNMKKYDEELYKFKEVYNSAWMDNWGFVPMTDEELKFMAKRLKPLIVPDLVFMAEKDGEIAGVSLTVPDYNFVFKRMKGSLFPFGLFKFFIYRGHIPRVRLLALGVKKEHRLKGIEIAFIWKLMEVARKRGYIGGELSWTLEDNRLINSIIEKVGGRLYRRYRIYEKKIL